MLVAFICEGGAGRGGCGGSSATAGGAGEGAVGRRRRWSGGGCRGSAAAAGGAGEMVRGVLGGEGDRIWRGGIAIEMEGDRDRVSMKFKNIHEFKKCPYTIEK